MTARRRRLTGDYNRIKKEFSGNPFVIIETADNNLPERYVVTYRVPGLAWDNSLGRAVQINRHQAEIYLHVRYPREKPKCIMRTPIWHPNIGDYICIADHWAAGETLADIIVHIGDMIQYKIYNTASPVNSAAAAWARQNWKMFPIGTIDLLQPEPDLSLLPPEDSQKDDISISLEPPRQYDDLDIRLE